MCRHVPKVPYGSYATDIYRDPVGQKYCMVVTCLDVCIIYFISCDCIMNSSLSYTIYTAGNRHKQNSWFCKEIREDNFRFWWRRVHEDASQGMYMSKIEIFFFTARILQNQRMLCCGE